MYAARTRFIPADILHLFARCTWPQAPAATVSKNTQSERADIPARLRRMWS
jgi:DNA helicase-2/ATP-dependent DNA helicase PcrA